MEKYNLRIKPQKCLFGVSFKTFLGYIISRICIEVYPNKVKAIMEIPPKKLKQLRNLARKGNVIRIFIFQLSNKYAPFSHFLKKQIKFVYDEKYQQAF